QDGSDAPLDSVLDDEASNKDALLLTNAVGALDRLVLNGGVPPTVEEKHVIGELEVQTDAARAVAPQQDVLAAIGAKLCENGLPLYRWYSAVELQRPEVSQSAGQHLQRLDPLRENDGLTATVGHFRQIGLQLL